MVTTRTASLRDEGDAGDEGPPEDEAAKSTAPDSSALRLVVWRSAATTRRASRTARAYFAVALLHRVSVGAGNSSFWDPG